jgi:hypothetical protein
VAECRERVYRPSSRIKRWNNQLLKRDSSSANLQTELHMTSAVTNTVSDVCNNRARRYLYTERGIMLGFAVIYNSCQTYEVEN